MCIITRMVPQIKWMHKWFGKGYIITMLWASGTSLLIHNTGVRDKTRASVCECVHSVCMWFVRLYFSCLSVCFSHSFFVFSVSL